MRVSCTPAPSDVGMPGEIARRYLVSFIPGLPCTETCLFLTYGALRRIQQRQR
jgi:hypothetical protein